MNSSWLRKGIDVSREFGVGKLFDSYRPELHYMRGPGPKWHEKYDGVSLEAENEQQPELPYSLWLIPAAAFALLGIAAAVAFA
jgi:hypothetical protein